MAEKCPQCGVVGWHKMSCTGEDPRAVDREQDRAYGRTSEE